MAILTLDTTTRAINIVGESNWREVLDIIGEAIVAELADEGGSGGDPGPSDAGCPDPLTLPQATRDGLTGAMEGYGAWVHRASGGVGFSTGCDYSGVAALQPPMLPGEAYADYAAALVAAEWSA